MKIQDIVLVEYCLDKTVVKEFHLEEPIDESFIRYLGEPAVLEYFPLFPRPFFRITLGSQYVMKGVEGNSSFQIIFIRDTKILENRIREYIEQYEVNSASE